MINKEKNIWTFRLELGSTNIEWAIKSYEKPSADLIYKTLEERIGRPAIKNVLHYALENHDECYFVIDDEVTEEEDIVSTLAIEELMYPAGHEPEIKFIKNVFENAVVVLNLEEEEDGA